MVERLRPAAPGVELSMADGRTLRAGAVVLAANAWVGRLLPAPLDRVITPVRGQVLATPQLPPRRIRGAWSLNDGYEYLQQLPDGRVVLGGLRPRAEDREVGQAEPELHPLLQAGLVDWLRRAWPDLDLPPTEKNGPELRRWAGVMAFTPDRLPLIGAVPGMAGVWMAAGFNGHGLPFAPLAARFLAPAIAGRGLPEDAAPFRPERWMGGWHRAADY
jgi:glycine/D-amino acid oxidase-like deaminating enzyme